MSEKIQTRIFNYGNENESEWPSRFGTNDGKGFRKVYGEYYQPNKFGEAPMVIFDEMPTTYHEAAGRHISSRKEWEQADKEHNTITFSNREEVERTTKKGVKAEEKAIKEDRRKASRTAIQAWKENPKEMKEKLDKRSEVQYESAKKAGILDAVKTEIKEKIK